jgi:hemerythrin
MGTPHEVLFPWDDQYCLGISFADVQHQQLADSINRLHQALLDGREKIVIGRALEELITYSKAHFAAEEKVLLSYGYPDFLSHHSEHECLAYAVLELYQKIMSGEVRLNTFAVTFLKDWLREEILRADTKFAPFLKGKGVP